MAGVKMKLNAILTIYEKLTRGETILREEICARCNITERTFYRYIKELGKYFAKANKKMILVSKRRNGYRLEELVEPQE